MDANAQAVTSEELLVHRRWVRALARSLISDPAVADDVEQQTWVAAIEKPPRQAGNVRAWLARVVRRRRIDLARSATRRRERESRVSPQTEVPRPDELVSRAETQACITRAVLALEEPYRNTVLLRFFHGMPAREIAVHQGVPLETVRTRLGRALTQLRGRLSQEFGRDGADWRVALLPIAGLDVLPSAAVATGAGALTSKAIPGLACAGLLVAVLGAGLFLAELLSAETSSSEVGLSTGEIVARLVEEETLYPRLRGAPGATDARAPDDALAGGDGLVPEGAPAPRRGIGGKAPDERGRLPAAVDVLLQNEPVPSGVIGGVVSDDQGRPLALASVTLSLPPEASTRASVLTDDAGRFRFEGLEDVTFRVAVEIRSFAKAHTTTRPGRRGLAFTLARGHSISGRVVEEGTDVPVPGLDLEAVEGRGGAGARKVLTRSREDGTFVLRGLEAGAWTVTAGPRGVWRAPAAEFVPTRLGPVEAGTANLLVELERGLALEGVVHGPEGRPWAHGAGVRLTPVDVGGAVDYVGQRYARTTPDGHFRLTGLPRGRYDLTVVPKTEGEGAPICGLAHVRSVVAGTSGLVVELAAGQALVGRLVDETGEPVVGRGWVWVAPHGAPPGSPGSAAATLLEGGRFETTPLDPARDYDVKASGFAGYGGVTLVGVRVDKGEVVVVLPQGLEISGRVVDADGRPAPAGVPVMALVEGHREVSRPRPAWVYAYGYTDQEGRFTLSGLKDVPYTVQAGGSVSGFIGTAVRIQAPAKDVTLRVIRGVAFEGRLVDAYGNPVPFASLFAHDPGAKVRVPMARTRRDGSFAFVGVRSGKIRLTALIGESHIPLGEFEAPADAVTATVPE